MTDGRVREDRESDAPLAPALFHQAEDHRCADGAGVGRAGPGLKEARAGMTNLSESHGHSVSGPARRLTQSAQSTDLRTYQPLSSRVEMYSTVQSSPVAPTALFDCAT
jgi:hypothetical protein